MRRLPVSGFTLSELLIALSILGLIAVFTIPKVLQAQQDSRFRAVAKEAASAVAEAYQAYRLKNALTSSTGMVNLTPSLNYVKMETSGYVDHKQGMSQITCTGSIPCFRLHSGAVVWYDAVYSAFGGTSTTHGLFFLVDPDGKVTDGGSPTGPGKSVEFVLYTTGKLTTHGTAMDGINGSGNPIHAVPSEDPPWFSWNS